MEGPGPGGAQFTIFIGTKLFPPSGGLPFPKKLELKDYSTTQYISAFWGGLLQEYINKGVRASALYRGALNYIPYWACAGVRTKE